MKKLLIVLALVAAGGWWYWHRGLSEEQVAAFYDAQVDAFVHQDQKALCAQYAPDYQGTERQVSDAGVQVLHPDKALECRNLEVLFGLKKRFDEKQTNGDMLGVEFNVEHTSIEISRDRKSADVHLNVHLNFGGAFVADGTAVDHLVLRNGKLLSVGSESESRVSGILAHGGPVEAALSRLPGSSN